jgi:hypothetical protein
MTALRERGPPVYKFFVDVLRILLVLCTLHLRQALLDTIKRSNDRGRAMDNLRVDELVILKLGVLVRAGPSLRRHLQASR